MKALVTGGGGFVGKAIVTQLLARGDSVRSFSRGDYPDLRAAGVETVRGNLTDIAAVTEAVKGCNVVFHVAAKAGSWGAPGEFDRANVDGTRTVIDACRSAHIERLVYTSSPSVVYGGTPLEGVDESVPYPEHYDADYPRTKAIAEKLVLAANGTGLRTVALRPHLVWGPGDTNLIPRILARARAGKLRKIGSGRALVDTVYIDNAAEAHLLAADGLVPGAPLCGCAYFITNAEPIAVGDIIDGILRAAGLPPVRRSVPPWFAYFAGSVAEATWRVLGRSDEPPMTRFVAKQLSTAHWFNIDAAKRDLGYVPRVSIAEGLERLRRSFEGTDALKGQST